MIKTCDKVDFTVVEFQTEFQSDCTITILFFWQIVRRRSIVSRSKFEVDMHSFCKRSIYRRLSLRYFKFIVNIFMGVNALALPSASWNMGRALKRWPANAPSESALNSVQDSAQNSAQNSVHNHVLPAQAAHQVTPLPTTVIVPDAITPLDSVKTVNSKISSQKKSMPLFDKRAKTSDIMPDIARKNRVAGDD
ncbi:hypothetical protein [Glaciimonas sp. PAMC28666]|uniref:hypothetical protein n=1 Tax=Glaciimonas sp. PAMC28666 TaxID=2807626 RepID=UPI0019635A8F|nr:hypothetical protein [Glaciimonas sp. PAMC28666]QRX81580.1 hypothetical protein JQN73_15640 [Glaciimonas sp. PAMC28666]